MKILLLNDLQRNYRCVLENTIFCISSVKRPWKTDKNVVTELNYKLQKLKPISETSYDIYKQVLRVKGIDLQFWICKKKSWVPLIQQLLLRPIPEYSLKDTNQEKALWN